ncbi:MAG TPA: hypothetical protein VN372_15675 [Methanospirillum sp.]|nr:hypothetical protein [Methanospirillum sp.]
MSVSLQKYLDTHPDTKAAWESPEANPAFRNLVKDNVNLLSLYTKVPWLDIANPGLLPTIESYLSDPQVSGMTDKAQILAYLDEHIRSDETLDAAYRQELSQMLYSALTKENLPNPEPVIPDPGTPEPEGEKPTPSPTSDEIEKISPIQSDAFNLYLDTHPESKAFFDAHPELYGLTSWDDLVMLQGENDEINQWAGDHPELQLLIPGSGNHVGGPSDGTPLYVAEYDLDYPVEAYLGILNIDGLKEYLDKNSDAKAFFDAHPELYYDTEGADPSSGSTFVDLWQKLAAQDPDIREFLKNNPDLSDLTGVPSEAFAEGGKPEQTPVANPDKTQNAADAFAQYLQENPDAKKLMDQYPELALMKSAEELEAFLNAHDDVSQFFTDNPDMESMLRGVVSSGSGSEEAAAEKATDLAAIKELLASNPDAKALFDAHPDMYRVTSKEELEKLISANEEIRAFFVQNQDLGDLYAATPPGMEEVSAYLASTPGAEEIWNAHPELFLAGSVTDLKSYTDMYPDLSEFIAAHPEMETVYGPPSGTGGPPAGQGPPAGAGGPPDGYGPPSGTGGPPAGQGPPAGAGGP